MSTLEQYIERFLRFGNMDKGFPLYQYDGGQCSYTIHISGIVHGNEVGSLPTLVHLIEDLESQNTYFGGQINISLGNLEAARLNRRFIDADLNRLFLRPQPKEHQSTHEGKRARELMPLLEQCDVVLDLHQTMLPSAIPFYIFPDTPQAIAIAEAIGGTTAYIDATPTNDTPTYQCADEFVWRQGKPALTLELGEAGFHTPADRASSTAVRNLITLFERLRIQHLLISRHSEDLLSTIQGSRRESLSWYTTVHREPYASQELQLRPNLINFHPVTKGERLTVEGTPALFAAYDGRLLFPKYPKRDDQGNICETLPKEIYRIIQKV